MSLKNKYQVKRINASETYDWLLHKHYAKRIPSISYAFGLFDDKNTLIGICTFGCPPSRSLCVGVCGIEYVYNVFELNRLCVNDGLEKNVLSYFISSCLNGLDDGLIVVSYADTSQGHHGYIYQATNWIYTGLSAKRTERYDINNPNKHSKSITQNKGFVYSELAVRERPQKHRYIYFTGNKTQRKLLKSKLNYEVQPYPKGENKRYDASYQPQYNTNYSKQQSPV